MFIDVTVIIRILRKLNSKPCCFRITYLTVVVFLTLLNNKFIKYAFNIFHQIVIINRYKQLLKEIQHT